LEILYSFTAGLSFCFSLLLFFSASKKSKQSLYLSIVFLIFSIILLSTATDFKNHDYEWKKNDLFTDWLYYIICPFFYLYLKSISTPKFKFTLLNYLHFLLPAFLQVLTLFVYFTLPIEKGAIAAWTKKPFGHFFNSITNLLFPYMFIYLLACWHLLYKHQKTIFQLAADADRRSLSWMRTFLAAITILFAFYVFTAVSGYFLNTVIDPIFYLLLMVFLGFHALQQPFVYMNLENIENNFIDTLPETNISPTKEPDRRLLAEKVKMLLFFEHNKPYLDNKLTLPKLAGQLGISHHLLSETINTIFKENFFQFINRHRVEYAAQLLLNKKYAHLTIEAIGYEAGFNSKTTFNNTFKKLKGLSPSEYKKKQVAE
jgi:AraC-like DNA-binding protein